MKKAKKAMLYAGLGQRYFDFWWHHRCNFDPLTDDQKSKGFYFVHIPKTAGTSVLSALGVQKTPYTHCPAHVIRSKYPKKSKNLLFFSVVRDPFERFASSFEYITKRTDWPEQRKFADDVIGDMSFSQFAAKIARNKLYRNLITGYEFFFPQSYFTHRNGAAGIHLSIRFETLAEDFNSTIKPRFSGVSELQNLRNHGGGDYRSLYDRNAIDLVQGIYSDDFDNFGYEMI